MTARWYLVYCKPRQESVARRNLERQGYATYFPLIRQSRRQKGRVRSIIAPMFPRYLFIQLSEGTDNWGPIRSTLGVVSLVKFGDVTAPVPNDLVDTLKAREDAQGVQPLEPPGLRSGERVRIADGGFAGYEGIFLARSARDRVTVLLQVLGRTTRTTVNLSHVEPVR